MNLRAMVIVVSLTGCLPSLHDLLGRGCDSDAECGTGLVCHRNVCTTGGSFERVPVDAWRASNEGGVEGGARAPTRPSLTVFSSSGLLPSARSGAAAAAGLFIGGTGTAEVLGANGPTTPLPSARSQAAATATGGRLLVLGGLAEGGGPLDEVWSAPLLEDGGAGEWAAEPALPSPRAGLSAVAAGGFVYALGGEAATGLSDEVLAAAMKGDGSLGPWRATARLPEGRARGGAAFFDGQLYVAGGACTGSCPPLRAPLLADGGVGAFAQLPPVPDREAPAVVVAGGALHVIGGRLGNGQVLSDVLSLPLAESARWQVQLRLPRALHGAAAFESQGVVQLAGGRGADGGVVADRFVASTTTAGADPYEPGPDIPEEGAYGSVVAWNGALYALGGNRNAGPIDAIHRAVPGPDGGLMPWALVGRLAAGASELGVVAWGGRLYLVTGCEFIVSANNCLSIGDLRSAPLFSDGGIGSFRLDTMLPGGDEISGMATVAVNGTLYMVGGVTGYSPTRREVWRSRIDVTTGGLSTPATTTPHSRDAGLWGHAVVASRGFLYVVGGQGLGGYGEYSDRVLAGRIAADGTVSSWNLASRMPQERSLVAAAVFDDTLYVASGCNETGAGGAYCGIYPRALLAAPLLLDGGVGAFASLVNHPAPTKGAALTAFNGRLMTSSGYDGNPHGWTYFATLHGRGRLGPSRALTALPAAKVAYAVAGGALYAFGADGSVSSSVLGASWSPAPSLTSVLAASATRTRLYAVSGQSVWSAALPVSAWTAEPELPRAMVRPAMAGTYLADGTEVFYLEGGAWQAGPALPMPVERLVLEGRLLFGISGDTGDVFVSSLEAGGAPGPWRRAEGLAGPRHGFGAVASDGMLYVAGGSGLSDVLVSTIRSDGTLGPWSQVGMLPAPWSTVGLVAEAGLLIALGDGVTAWPMYTPPSRGAMSMRVDLGSAVTEVEGVTLEGEGEISADVRLAGDDGSFGEWVTLGYATAGSELLIGRPARYLWLRVTLYGDARVTGGSIATKL